MRRNFRRARGIAVLTRSRVLVGGQRRVLRVAVCLAVGVRRHDDQLDVRLRVRAVVHRAALVVGTVLVRELPVLAAAAPPRLPALALHGLGECEFVERHLTHGAQRQPGTHDVDAPHEEEDDVRVTAADGAGKRRILPVDAAQHVAERAAEASHHREGAQSDAVVLGHAHVDEVGATRRLARVAAEVQHDDADDREQDAPPVIITHRRRRICYRDVVDRRVSARRRCRRAPYRTVRGVGGAA